MRHLFSAYPTSLRARTLTLAAATAVILAQPARAQVKTDSIIAPEAGKAMCNVLKPADFARVGLTVSEADAGVEDDGASVYCVFPAQAGKVELDVFYGTNTSAPQAIQIERVTMSNVGAQFKPVPLPDADDAQMGSGNFRGSAFTSIVVRRGTAVISLGIPTTPRAQAQLLELAGTAIHRIHRT